MHASLLAFSSLVCALVAAAPSIASAQAIPRPSIELYGGYSYLRDPGNSVLAATAGDDSFRIGWAAGAARPVWRAIAAVGEASGHYKTRTTFDDDVRLSFHAFLGGPRASMTVGPVIEFVQILAGAVHSRGSAFGVTAATTDLSLQPGGGVDYPLRSRVAARLQLDYRWIKGDGDRHAASQFRAVAAIVLH